MDSMYLHRTLEDFIRRISRQFPAVLVTGARQVGKTTLLKYLKEGERSLVTNDDPMILNLARSDPALFIQRFPPPVLIDEIQYAPGLLPHIKMTIDINRRPGVFWLTGSQQFHLMQRISESLAGRIAIIKLLGLSRRELMGQYSTSAPFVPVPEMLRDEQTGGGRPLGLMELYDLIWRGSFPEIALKRDMDRNIFFSSYVQTYLQRDVRDLARVGDEMTFLRFIRAAAARTGQMLNLSELARDAGIAPNTAKKWLSIMEASGIIYLLEPYFTNLTKRMVKTPKLYFLDTGLCAYLTGWSSPETLEAGAMSGAILETWILTELLKTYWHNGLEAPFFYYRDKDKKEIDLLIIRDGTIYPLEFKKTASPGKNDVRHFRMLERLPMPTGTGGIICLTGQALPLTSRAWSIPVGVS